MKTTQQLSTDHIAIKQMLQVMEALSTGAFDDVKAGHMASIIDFLRTYADTCHHGKEEALLFPAMEQAGIPSAGGPVSVMLHEHTLGRGFIRGMHEALTQFQDGDTDAAAGIRENALSYVNLLRAHIDKEDGILFPMADRFVPGDVHEQLTVEFDRVENEILGGGRREEYEQLLQTLSAHYL